MVTLKEILEKKLTKKEFAESIFSYDMMGSIATIEIPDELSKKEKIIGESILKIHPHIKTVLKKVGIHKGRYRWQKLKVIAGEKTKIAEYKENDSRLRLDVEKVYFSPRSGTERKRVYQQVKKGEKILVMFSGCAPYPIVIARNAPAKEIYGIELNPLAHKFAVENIKLNKLSNVVLIKGDVKKEVLKLKKEKIKFDRIVMPLPKKAEVFLESAFLVAKKGTIIHFYTFSHSDDFDEMKKKLKKKCKELGKSCRILKLVKCGHYSPRVYRICIDFKVN